jgi:hypothetical protein
MAFFECVANNGTDNNTYIADRYDGAYRFVAYKLKGTDVLKTQLSTGTITFTDDNISYVFAPGNNGRVTALVAGTAIIGSSSTHLNVNGTASINNGQAMTFIPD